ncbi:MAG TPA: restriction endonuclease [Leeuwenhoekiella sp.]|nr:restriction endonuclease [Leeuwenhoekiella sp.]
MTEEQRTLILKNAQDFFRREIVAAHLGAACDKASRLKSYNVNPFLVKYLANFLEGDDNPKSMAKALVYPRLLSTSITTIFGNKVQKMIPEIFEGMMGSIGGGIDIEFIDSTDNRRKYCQLKAGPNTINKDDVITIKNHFQSVKNLARTNHRDVRTTDMIVGVLYGTPSELSGHYKKINKDFPVFVGKEFWYRLTGLENFYLELSNAIGEVALEVDGRKHLQEAIDSLALEIEAFLEEE